MDRSGKPARSFFGVTKMAIRHAVANGMKAVALGAGSYQGKVLRGAQVHGLWSAVVPPQPLEETWQQALTRPFPQAVEAGCA
ncbi:hypothetical protein [Catellatospora sichuanensis]|uniref:hypothetical protein n=1 Tax=Catellatospora sichuanensis TaxID=1969805 RepID=UPI0011830824|nr:hypothetical protein [Catellatospora sichuanensis]